MKTHTIKTPKAELLVVELQTEVINSSYHIRKTPKGILLKDNIEEKFISNKYTLLGKPDEIKEEDAMELVQYLTRRDYTITPKNYLEGKDGRFEDITFAESLLSAIESEIYWENPLGEKPIWNAHELQCTGYFSYMQGLKRWKEAKSRTFDRNRCLILYKQLKHK